MASGADADASVLKSGVDMKKRLICYFISCLLSFNLFANDTYFFTSGGNLRPADDGNTSIQMNEEVIHIVCEPDYYQVSVDFEFKNPGKETSLSVGFPFFEAGIGGHGKIFDFECWTNGRKEDYKDMLIDRSFSNSDFDSPKLVNAYVRQITFAEKSVTRTKVSYKSEYGHDDNSRIIKYLYGTGSSWANKIGKISVIVENNLPHEFISLQSEPWKRIADNKWRAVFYNTEPSYTDCFTFNAQSIFHDYGPKSFPAYFPYTTKKASAEQISCYTINQLRLVRNTIYALHGYDFQSPELNNFFSDWGRYWSTEYKVNPDFSEDDFSEIEKYNIQLFKSEETRLKSEFAR